MLAGTPSFVYGLHKGVGTRRNMHAFISVVTSLSALLLRLMSVPPRNISRSLWLTVEIGDCRATQILPARSAHYVSAVAHRLDSSAGLRICGPHPSISCAAISHDLAGNLDVDGHVLHDASDCQQERQWLEHLPLQVLRSCLGRCFSLVLRPGLVDACSQLLQCDHLARTQECGGVKSCKTFFLV